MEHYYRKYGNLKSMIQELNTCLRRLNSYLKEPITEIGALTTIEYLLNDLPTKIKDKNGLVLADSIKFDCVEVSNVSQVIIHCSENEQCGLIERAWRDCCDSCTDVKDTIDAMKAAINCLPKNNINKEAKDIVDNDTIVYKLIQICNQSECDLSSPLNIKEMKRVYEETIKDFYKTRGSMESIWTHVIISVSIVMIMLFLFIFCSCTNSNKSNNLVTVSINADKEKIALCDKIDRKIDKLDSVRFNNGDTTVIIKVQMFFLKDSLVICDSVFQIKSEWHYFNTDTTINRIMIIPIHRCYEKGTCNNDDKTLKNKDKALYTHYLFKLVMIAVIIIALLLLFLILRPVLEKSVDYKNKINEKILYDRLKIQNDWQDILQERYRLENRKEEYQLNIREKQEKARIDNDTREREFFRQRKMREMELEHDYKKALLEQSNRNSQNNDQRLKDLNEQIIKLLISLISK